MYKRQGVNFNSQATADAMSFGLAIELAVAMPLSWLPLISDYTREAEDPRGATLTSTVIYTLVSMWMYVIGMGMALVTEAVSYTHLDVYKRQALER